MSPDIEAALERHTASMFALRSHFTKAAQTIQQQIRDGSITRKAGSDRIAAIYVNHVGQVRLAEASLPSPDGEVTELATKCPWCDAEEEVQIEALPEDKDEPDFEQAKAVTDYLKKSVAKQKRGA